MIRHTVLFKWTDGATSEQKQKIAAGLSALPAIVPSRSRRSPVLREMSTAMPTFGPA